MSPESNVAARVSASFARQIFMATLGARLVRAAPGEVEIELPCRPEIAQQHGFVHAGAVAAIVDSACGYAALTLMPPDAGVLSVEFKINLLAPAAGERIVARGRVLRPGRALHVCLGEAFAVQDGQERPVATMLATMMCLRDRPDLTG